MNRDFRENLAGLIKWLQPEDDDLRCIRIGVPDGERESPALFSFFTGICRRDAGCIATAGFEESEENTIELSVNPRSAAIAEAKFLRKIEDRIRKDKRPDVRVMHLYATILKSAPASERYRVLRITSAKMVDSLTVLHRIKLEVRRMERIRNRKISCSFLVSGPTVFLLMDSNGMELDFLNDNILLRMRRVFSDIDALISIEKDPYVPIPGSCYLGDRVIFYEKTDIE